MIPDFIEKQILLRASRSRVWRALTDSAEFGAWFGIKFDAPFIPGTPITGVIAPVTEGQEKYKGMPFNMTIEKIEPEHLFSFRWHPFAIDPNVDYSAEPTTLIEFKLEDAGGGTMLTVTESGFDKIPLERRQKAFEANEKGWTGVTKLIEKYLEQNG